MLNDPWLKLPDDWDPFVSRHHSREIKKATDPEYTLSETTPSDYSSEEESEEENDEKGEKESSGSW